MRDITSNGPIGRTERRTEYGLMYRGEVMVGQLFASREAVDAYVANAIGVAGQDPADYEVIHRVIVVEPFWITTPAPAQLARS